MNQAQISTANQSTDLNGFTSEKSIAISAGPLTMSVREEVIRLLTVNKKNFFKTMIAGLTELKSRKLISNEEHTLLQGVIKLILSAQKKPDSSEQAFLEIRKIFHTLLRSPNASPVALAMVSVAESSFVTSPLKLKVVIIPMDAASGALAGAAIGATIGGIAGGGLGAAIGAAVGAAAGAVVGLCNDAGV